jgi:hypothetical protein
VAVCSFTQTASASEISAFMRGIADIFGHFALNRGRDPVVSKLRNCFGEVFK